MRTAWISLAVVGLIAVCIWAMFACSPHGCTYINLLAMQGADEAMVTAQVVLLQAVITVATLLYTAISAHLGRKALKQEAAERLAITQQASRIRTRHLFQVIAATALKFSMTPYAKQQEGTLHAFFDHIMQEGDQAANARLLAAELVHADEATRMRIRKLLTPLSEFKELHTNAEQIYRHGSTRPEAQWNAVVAAVNKAEEIHRRAMHIGKKIGEPDLVSAD